MASILHGSRLALRRTIQGRSSEFSQLRLSSSVSTNTSENNVNDATTHFGFTTVRTEEKESKVREVFESVAESYDVMNDLMSGGLHRLWKDDLLHRTGLAPTSRALRRLHHASAASDQTTPPPTLNVLDVAGGTGDVAFRFIEAAGCHERSKSSGQDPIQVTVCDINAEMLRVGERRARQRYGSGLLDETKALSFVEGNAQTLPFEDNSFDLYTIAFGLRNVTHVDMALKDAFRVLKPGGRFMCLEFSHVTNPAFRAIYDTYSFHVIPTIGDIVANDRASYQYLVESIRKFSNQDELASRLDRAGFSGAKYTNMTGGIVALHEGWKPV